MRTFCLLIAWLISFSLHAQLDRIRVKGNQFISSSSPVIFRGLDASDPYKLQLDGHWNKRYLEEIKRWGANIVRFPVHPIYWQKLGKEKYIKLLDQGVKWATSSGCM